MQHVLLNENMSRVLKKKWARNFETEVTEIDEEEIEKAFGTNTLWEFNEMTEEIRGLFWALFQLYEYGGVYIHHDLSPDLQEEDIPDVDFVTCVDSGGRSLKPAFFMSKKKKSPVLIVMMYIIFLNRKCEMQEIMRKVMDCLKQNVGKISSGKSYELESIVMRIKIPKSRVDCHTVTLPFLEKKPSLTVPGLPGAFAHFFQNKIMIKVKRDPDDKRMGWKHLECVLEFQERTSVSFYREQNIKKCLGRRKRYIENGDKKKVMKY
jgi:hypothetical protein